MRDCVVALLWAMVFWLGAIMGEHIGYRKAMNEALDMGLAVQCVGKPGVYWECD